MRTVVMARGNSLKRINEIKDINFDMAVIINAFYQDLKHKEIYDFLKDKEIVHMLATDRIPPSEMPKRMYQKLNVKYCVANRTIEQIKQGGKLTDYLPDHVSKIEIEKYDIGMEVRYMPDDWDDVTEKIMKGAKLRSTGLVGLAYGAMYLNSDEVYAIGLDFHDTPYYANKQWWADERKRRLMDQMKEGMAVWIKGTPHIKYHIITGSSYRFEAPNVEFL